MAGILFDIDGTLLDRRNSFEDFARDQFRRLVKATNTVSEDAFVELLIRLDRNGKRGKRELFSRAADSISLPELADSLYLDFRAAYPSHIRAFPEVPGVLKELARLGYRMAVVTNGSRTRQRYKVKALGLDRYVPDDLVIVSSEVGAAKPAPRAFLLALERLSISDPGEAVFVGNDPWVDISGARSVGLTAYWRWDPFWADAPPAADAVIYSLRELLELIAPAR